MDKKVAEALNDFTDTLKSTPLESFTSAFQFYISDIEFLADNCQLDTMLNHMRDLGSIKSLMELRLWKLENQISDSQSDEIYDKLGKLYDAFDNEVINRLNSQCGCKAKETTAAEWEKISFRAGLISTDRERRHPRIF